MHKRFRLFAQAQMKGDSDASDGEHGSRDRERHRRRTQRLPRRPVWAVRLESEIGPSFRIHPVDSHKRDTKSSVDKKGRTALSSRCQIVSGVRCDARNALYPELAENAPCSLLYDPFVNILHSRFCKEGSHPPPAIQFLELTQRRRFITWLFFQTV